MLNILNMFNNNKTGVGMGTTVTIREMDERLWREAKAEAARENITIADAMAKAINAWLSPKAQKKASPFDIKPFSGVSGPGASEEDAAIYGHRAGEKPYDIPRRREK
jgi:hypothetical protein